MGKLIAIGGGELRYSETLSIDKYIVSLSSSKRPKVLFIPTASHEAKGYIEIFEKVYTGLGCLVDSLLLIDNENDHEIKEKILSSDIIYVGGGDTKYMLDIWMDRKVDLYLKEAWKQGVVLSGLSAGAICWFEYGHSDSLILEESNNEHIFLNCLGLVKGIYCPHYDEKERRNDFSQKIKNSKSIGFAVESNCALEIMDNQYKIVKANVHSKAYKIHYENNDLTIEELNNEYYKPIQDLYKK